MKKIKLAIIGCGNIAKTHADQWGGLQNKLDVAFAVDPVIENAQKIADILPSAKVVSNYRDIIDSVDAVLLTLPHQFHYGIAMDCLRRGKHVLLEKPMANTEKECQDLINESQKSGRVFMIAYCMRYHPLVVKLKQLLDTETYGKPFQVSIWTEQYTYLEPEAQGVNGEKLGGGQLFSHGCHYIDLLLWFLGKPVSGTHAGTNLGTPWMQREGTSNVTVKFESGAMGYHFGTWGARGSKLNYSIHAHCTEAMIEADISNGKLIVHKGAEKQCLLEVEPRKYMDQQMEHFLDCIQNGKTPLTDAKTSLEGLQVIWKVYQAESRNVVADLRGLWTSTND